MGQRILPSHPEEPRQPAANRPRTLAHVLGAAALLGGGCGFSPPKVAPTGGASGAPVSTAANAGPTGPVPDEAAPDGTVPATPVDPDAPVVKSITATVTMNRSVAIEVDGHAPGDAALRYAIVRMPEHGMVAPGGAPNLFEYSPAPDFVGDDTFLVSASAGAHTSAPASVRIVIGDSRSCKALHGSLPGLASGIRSIDPDGTGPKPAEQVFCEMTTAGGGWTLVGRSVPGGNGPGGGLFPPTGVLSGPPQPFGWSVDRGSLKDTSAPYSLSVTRIGMDVSEALIGSYESGFQLAQAFRLAFPDGPLASCGSAYCRAEASHVSGPCQPATTPTALAYAAFDQAGATAYAFSSGPASRQMGLFEDGFQLGNDASCAVSGGLDSTQGLLFAR